MVSEKRIEARTINRHTYMTEIKIISYTPEEVKDHNTEIKSDKWLHFNGIMGIETEEIKYFVE